MHHVPVWICNPEIKAGSPPKRTARQVHTIRESSRRRHKSAHLRVSDAGTATIRGREHNLLEQVVDERGERVQVRENRDPVA